MGRPMGDPHTMGAVLILFLYGMVCFSFCFFVRQVHMASPFSTLSYRHGPRYGSHRTTLILHIIIIFSVDNNSIIQILFSAPLFLEA